MKKYFLMILFNLVLINISVLSQDNNTLFGNSNVSYIKTNEDIINYLEKTLEDYEPNPYGGPIIRINNNVNKVLYPLTNEKKEFALYFYRTEEAQSSYPRVKKYKDTGYKTFLNLSISILVPYNVYLENYRNKLETIESDDKLIELLKSSKIFKIQMDTGLNIVGDNCNIVYSSPKYIDLPSEEVFINKNNYVMLRNKSDAGLKINKSRLEINTIDTKDKLNAIISLEKLINNMKPIGNGNKIFLFIPPWVSRDYKTYIDINKIGNNPPFEIEFYKKSIVEGVIEEMYIKTEKLTLLFKIFFKIEDYDLLQKYIANKINKELIKDKVLNSYQSYFIDEYIFLSFLRQSYGFNITILEDEDVLLEYTFGDYSSFENINDDENNYVNLFINRNEYITKLIKDLDILNNADKYGIKYQWNGYEWKYK